MKSLRELRDGSSNYSSDKTGGDYREILIDEIIERENIRTTYPEESIRELAESIERDGLLQPIVVIKDGEEEERPLYKVIAGHRRLRAYQYLKAQDKPSYNAIRAIVRKTINDIETIQLVENIQREDLSPSDLERAVKSIIKREGLSQSQLAQRVGKTRQWISLVLKAEGVRNSLEGEIDRGALDTIPTFSLAELSRVENVKERAKTARKALSKGGTQKETRKAVKKALGKEEEGGDEHHKLVNLYYQKAKNLDRGQLAHIAKKILEDCLVRFKGKDKERFIKDIKTIIKHKGV